MSQDMDRLMVEVEEYIKKVVDPIDIFEYWAEVVVYQEKIDTTEYTDLEIETAVFTERDQMVKVGEWLELDENVFFWWEDVKDAIEEIKLELDQF